MGLDLGHDFAQLSLVEQSRNPFFVELELTIDRTHHDIDATQGNE